ncbi:MAG: hypothetical protein M0Q53_20835, partial [Prolixibacteraceae bacterium]|nr:hypothetical protein [Prolixibacteraceae bacterium]
LQSNITESSVQNILSSKDCEQRLFRDNAGNVKGVGFDYNNLNISHEKNFKGLYYKKFNVRFPDNFKIYIIDLDRQKRIIESIKDNLEKNSSWQCSGHEDILKYRIEMVKQTNLGNYDKATKRNEADLILCQLVYHKNHDIVLLGVRDRLRRRQIN